MQGESVTFQGRVVPKEGFRTYIFNADMQRKLVNSWSEFQKNMATGLWFANKEDIKPKKKRKKVGE